MQNKNFAWFQIEESLEEFAPACTLELLALTPTSDNNERRRGALGALRELLRQGLDADPSCQVQDWPYFLHQALSRLTASEMVELLSWDALALTRKNRKSLESQTQRTVIDFNCFYLAMLAHIAIGFSTRWADMVTSFCFGNCFMFVEYCCPLWSVIDFFHGVLVSFYRICWSIVCPVWVQSTN